MLSIIFVFSIVLLYCIVYKIFLQYGKMEAKLKKFSIKVLNNMLDEYNRMLIAPFLIGFVLWSGLLLNLSYACYYYFYNKANSVDGFFTLYGTIFLVWTPLLLSSLIISGLCSIKIINSVLKVSFYQSRSLVVKYLKEKGFIGKMVKFLLGGCFLIILGLSLLMQIYIKVDDHKISIGEVPFKKTVLLLQELEQIQLHSYRISPLGKKVYRPYYKLVFSTGYSWTSEKEIFSVSQIHFKAFLDRLLKITKKEIVKIE